MRVEGNQDESVRDEERRLLRRMSGGDEAAFDHFCDVYIPVVYRFVGRRLRGDRELTREIVQTTICKVIGRLDSFGGRSSLSTWLCACARNEIGMHFRRRGRRGAEIELDETQPPADAATPLPVAGPERDLLRRESAGLVHAALDALPPRYGRVLEWKYLERLPVREIARRLGLGLKAAESLLTRARRSFRETYDRLAAGTGSQPAGERRTSPGRRLVER